MASCATLFGFLLAAAGCQQPDREQAQPLHTVWETPAAAEAPRPVSTPPVAAGAPASRPAGTANATTAPAFAAIAGETIATVNGESITRSAVVDALVVAHGLDMLEKFIVTAALRQKANSLGITITDADVEEEYADALRRITTPLDAVGGLEAYSRGGAGFDRAAAERVIEEFFASKNIARSEFMMRMRQNAYLRKIAEREIKVDDGQLADEYKRAYGEKVQVRCIQVSTPEAIKQVRAALDTGKDFELVARQMCENRVVAARGGLLPPFTRYDDVPKLLRDTAFALHVGQISTTIHENNMFFVLRLEKRFPPSEVGVENVRDDLRRRIVDRLVRERMDTLAGELFRAASVQINDPALQESFQKRYPEKPRGTGRR